MGIKIDPVTKTFTVTYAKRNPETKQSVNLRRIGIKTKAEANRVFNELVVQVEDKIRRKVLPTWGRLVDEFVEAERLRGLKSSTIYSEEKCLRKYTADAWRDRICDTISKVEILDVVERAMEGKAPSHKHYVLKIIRSVFQLAVDQGFLQSNPAPVLKFRRTEKIKPVLSEPQAKLLLEKAREVGSEWYPHWALALYTGMRNGELYALRWDVVDLERKKIKVCRSWNNRNGFKDTKSGDDRIIDIAPAAMPLMLDLYASRIDDFVLPRIRKWDKGEQARDLRAFLLGMGLHPIRFHDLRASWATMLLGRGIEPVKVMKMGGWKDIETLMIYIRKAGIDVSGALEGLKLHDHHHAVGEVLPFKTNLL